MVSVLGRVTHLKTIHIYLPYEEKNKVYDEAIGRMRKRLPKTDILF